MSKNRMNKMTTIATRREWAAKVLCKHVELTRDAHTKAKRHAAII